MAYLTRMFIQKLVITLFFLLSISETSAQKGSQLFFELGGFGKAYSANYSMKITKDRSTFKYIRFGLAIEENRLVAPVGFITLKGERDHFFELSGGLTFISEGFNFLNRDESDIFLKGVVGLAYRYQPFRRPAYVSIGLFPYLRWDVEPNEINANQLSPGFSPGISIGYRIPN